MTTRWLTAEEQRAWRAYIAATHLLEDAIDRQLQQEAGMPHLYYSILANLSDVPDRRLRMTDLAEKSKITRSRLTYAVTRLEKDGLVRREGCPSDKRGSTAILTDAGMEVLERTAPGRPRGDLRPSHPGAGGPAGGDQHPDRAGAGDTGGRSVAPPLHAFVFVSRLRAPCS
jgi:DNA-binding MarR family transcriptional regulator